MLLVPKAVDRLLSIQLLQWVIATVDFGEVGLSHVPSALSSVQRATTFIRVYIASLNKFSQKIKIFFSRPPAALAARRSRKKGGVSDVTPPPSENKCWLRGQVLGAVLLVLRHL